MVTQSYKKISSFYSLKTTLPNQYLQKFLESEKTQLIIKINEQVNSRANHMTGTVRGLIVHKWKVNIYYNLYNQLFWSICPFYMLEKLGAVI